MAMVCAPPRRAIKARGAVIVNVHSRYILTHRCIRSSYTVDNEDEEREKREEREKEAEKRSGRVPPRSYRGEKKVTRDLAEEDRANNPASCR